MAGKWRDSDLQHDVSSSSWIAELLLESHTTRVGSLVPAGFDAYARVLHPATSIDTANGSERRVRWGDVARYCGAIAHGGMEWGAITSKTPQAKRFWSDPPSSIAFWPQEEIAALSEVLQRQTETPAECSFAFWEGNTALDGIDADQPKAVIGEYRYYVVKGPVERAADELRGLRAHLWWPVDQAWCVASHFDFTSTFVGGSHECIDAVVRAAQIEAWPVAAEQLIMSGSDVLNS